MDLASTAPEAVWLACGENCMPIDVLRRFGLKSPSTPFSACRSNVDHLHYFETTSYASFFDRDYIVKANAFTGECYLHIKWPGHPLFGQGRHSMYEMTHHNPLDPADCDILRRRIDRMQALKSSAKPVVIVYHHRSNRGFNRCRQYLEAKLFEILQLYQNASAFCYSQLIVDSEDQRRLEFSADQSGAISFATLACQHGWGGHDLDIFFGRNDDNLFHEAISRHIEMCITPDSRINP